jgi:katanin p60 ATPase-containing subunit A1
MLRRLEKRIIVDLPTVEARKKMFMHHLPPCVIKEDHGFELNSELDYDLLAEVFRDEFFFGSLIQNLNKLFSLDKQTDGYSGSDIQLVCKEAAMKTIRKVFAVLENLNESKTLLIYKEHLVYIQF